MDSEFPGDIDLRDALLQPYLLGDPRGGIRRFKHVPLDLLEKLILHGFVRLGKWNSCPGVQDLFLPFLRRHPEFTAHGYAVSKERKDCRIDIEGVECDAPMAIETVIDFAKTFRFSDDFNLTPTHARCWYD
jgi:hypothetical protein